MKKIWLSCMTLIAVLFAASSFAAASVSGYHTTIAPISDALNQHKLAHALVNGPGQGTDIVVINYTENDVRVCTPYSCNVLTRLTSERITDSSYSDMAISLFDNRSSAMFWNQYTPSYATVSVYVSAGKYVVYMTRN